MATIPQPVPATLRAIYAAYEAANEQYDSLGISVGEVGTECDRALFYNLRWASQPEEIDGRKLSIFRTGDRWEEVLTADLEAIGVAVWGQQDRIRLLSGHVRGKRDGACVGIPEAPKTEHLLEFKSSNDAGFKQIAKHGVREAKPMHYGQLQIGMHAFGLKRAAYLVVNKNNDERYFERVEYDIDWTLRQLARLERIIAADEPPPRISDKPDFFGCNLCRHKAVCKDGEFPRVSCRVCIHATPEMGGDGHWSCARFTKPLSVDEQKEACPAHLFVPAMVPGELLEVDQESETIAYRMANGEIWIDGATQEAGL